MLLSSQLILLFVLLIFLMYTDALYAVQAVNLVHRSCLCKVVQAVHLVHRSCTE